MGKMAVLIVDVQKALVEAHPYREEEFLQELENLADSARKAGTEIIYVRHDGGAGDKLESGTEGWKIHEAVEPKTGERIFDKSFNSAFLETDLEEYLKEKQITDLILMGMQTEYCIDATCKAAFELGYGVVIPTGATTTYDNEFMSGEATVRFYEEKIWAGRFADLMPAEAVLVCWAADRGSRRMDMPACPSGSLTAEIIMTGWEGRDGRTDTCRTAL